ncbi:hypothetical protein NDU88_007879 [Pleurodeles waltl]|uniref:Uncharacterized protein n=1 Tax=Pleurodeles waltl TaxID=8319 RepID=A0AAV7N3A5_PLEWA|nr:hypothetical protein NDU88_007879 [Pleurodeles waltl]
MDRPPCCRISEIKDYATNMTKCLEKRKQFLKLTVAKYEELEARSCRNNLWMVGLVESRNLCRPVVFVKNLLTELFGQARIHQNIYCGACLQIPRPRSPTGHSTLAYYSPDGKLQG